MSKPVRWVNLPGRIESIQLRTDEHHMTSLALCGPGRIEAEQFVARNFSDLIGDADRSEGPMSSDALRGGQSQAEKALAAVDLTDYARDRNHAYPHRGRGATRLSPYIRHGLLTLPRLWTDIDGPPDEVNRFRIELLWQEYARHWYGRLGLATREPLQYRPRRERRRPPRVQPAPIAIGAETDRGWNEAMGCMEITSGELFDDGWLVGQTRLWMASQWAVRERRDWRAGEDLFFRHLLDGSRAANRLGWHIATGLTSGRAYAVTRWQVEARAPGLCASCELNTDCPIDTWPEVPPPEPIETPNPLLFDDPDLERTSGPLSTTSYAGDSDAPIEPDVVWITAESMGLNDPALTAHPNLPVVFVFDRPLLAKLRLSAKRLTFLAETLAELATVRPLEVHLGTPAEALDGRRVATTFAPVPGWRRHAAAVEPVAVHPWPWLRRPAGGDISSFSAWFRGMWGHEIDDRPLDSAVDHIPMSPNMS